MTGTIAVLNVGTGDTKLSFDKNNPAERIRAARIVTDMIRRGYALLVDIGGGKFQRVQRFDEECCEYIIADFDPVTAAEADKEEQENEQAPSEGQAAPAQRKPAKRGGGGGKLSLKAEQTSAVAIPRRAGG